MTDHTNEATGVTQSESKNSRREFLKKAGKVAIYAPPAVLLLSKPSFATLKGSYDNCGPRDGQVRPNFNFRSFRR